MEEQKALHWADKIAQQIIARQPNKEEYVCAAGISPSGSVHIGNFRDVATSAFVAKALRKAGKKARLLFSWDNLDRMRKVPKNVAEITSGFETNIGRAYVDIENPFKEDTINKTYAAHFEKEFEQAIKPFGIEMDFRHQAEMYRSGKYQKDIIFALEKRKQIFDILDKHRTQDAAEGERDNYYPVSIYCPICGRDTTTILSLSDDCTVAKYECKCGHTEDFDFTKNHNCKLSWKVDWAMRWRYEQVDFEPGGIDHATVHGSYDTSKDISKQIFGYSAPIFQGYGFIGIKGLAGKMSGSTGLNLTPKTLLRIYQPEVLLWLYAKNDPKSEFDFCFDDGILRHYFEFDKMYAEVKNGIASDATKAIMYYTEVQGHTLHPVPFGLLIQLGSVVDFNVDLLKVVLSKIEHDYTTDDLAERLQLAKNWIEECSPESVNRIRSTRNWEVFNNFSAEEKEEIKQTFEYLQKGDYTLETLQTQLYAIPREIRNLEKTDKELKKVQTQFFSNVYKLLIDKEQGPRLYLFLFAISPEKYLHLLDFSFPKTDEEAKIEENLLLAKEIENQPIVEEKINTEIVVEDFKSQMTLEDFNKIDIRVCEILKCEEIRKSHNCYKITVFDGKDKRTIVSSIKNYYKSEELIGKKIMVLVNLAATRIAGITSEGMLLAGTFNDYCKVVFVDDIIPAGTIIR